MERIQVTLAVLLICSLFIHLGLLGAVFGRNDRRGSLYFALLIGASMFYVLGYLLEIFATTPSEVMFAIRVEYIGVPLSAPAFMLTALGFFRPKMIKKWMVPLIIAYGMVMFLIVFTSPYHNLFYTSVDMAYNGGIFVVVLGKGVLYYVQHTSAILCMLGTYAFLIILFITGNTKRRRQMILFLIGSIICFIPNLMNILGTTPLGLEFLSFSMTIALTLFYISLYHQNMLDIIPAAFDMAIENLDDAVVVLDNEWEFVYCNQRARELFPALNEYTGTERIADMPGWPSELSPASQQQTSFIMSDPMSGNNILQQADILDIHNRNGAIIGKSIKMHDITELTNMLNQLEELAITDPLTGAFNRRHFETLINRQLSRASRQANNLGLAMLDIDHFKIVNDTYSHLAGDEVLREMVHTVSDQLREGDIIARFGGEEFIFFSIEESESGLLALANRLRQAIEDAVIVFDGIKIPVTASFGAVMIAPGQSYEDALAAVDKALYQAKETGRNRVVIGKIND